MTDAVDCQVSDPPLTLGSDGLVPSIRTVPDVAGSSGVQSESLPALSTERKSGPCGRYGRSFVSKFRDDRDGGSWLYSGLRLSF